jgi:hypothetical protein
VAGALVLALICSSSLHPWGHPLLLVPLGLAWFTFWLRPHLGLQALLALLPVANQSIWSGWRVTDEFDLLLMAVLAAGYARLAFDRCPNPPAADAQSHRSKGLSWLLLTGILASTLLSAWRAWLDLPPGESWRGQDWLFGDYDSPANIWRVGKSAFWLLLALPWLHQLVRLDRDACERALCRGMLTGLVLVCALSFWERHAYVGLGDPRSLIARPPGSGRCMSGAAPSMPTWSWPVPSPIGRLGKHVHAWPGWRRPDC